MWEKIFWGGSHGSARVPMGAGSVVARAFQQKERWGSLSYYGTDGSRKVGQPQFKPKQGPNAMDAPRPFRWEELDQRLLSHKLQEISDEMQRRSAEGERKAAFDTRQSGNSAGYLGRLFDFEERLADEWVEKVYVAHCETWVQQNRSITGEFIRAVRDRAVVQVIAARKSTVRFQASLRGTRISEPVNPISLRSWNMRMDRLASRWTRKLEADAVAGEYRAARPADTNDDRRFALLAVEEARKSVAEDDKSRPLVGAVVAKDGKVLAKAHRGESPKSHAEFIALEEKLKDEAIAEATVYTTLEPCTKRNPPKISCAQRLVDRKVSRVFIGMLDPNPDIRGLGEQLLSSAGIDVQFFPRDLRSQVEELNRDFIRSHRGKSRGADSQADRELRRSTSHASPGMSRNPDEVIAVDATLKGKQTYHVKLRLGLRNLWGSNPTPDDRAVIEEKLDPMAGLVVEDGDYEMTYSFDGKDMKVNRRVVSGQLFS
jgi:pyrimidine deaminase RibD-like protein